MSKLKVKNITKHFGGVKAVTDCSFEVEPGKITALIGPNGAGKTTMFNLITGFINPDKGEISFNDQDITKLPDFKRADLGMSRTFQAVRLFINLTVSDNLLLAIEDDDQKFFKSFFGKDLKQKHEERIKKVLDQVDLVGFEKHVASELSYGQQKLIALGRALLQRHTFLMLDEPVAGVNPVLRQKLKQILLELKKEGETLLLIEHDMDFVMGIADTVIVMDAGKVLMTGSPQEVKNNEKVLEAYLGGQV